MKIVCAGEIMLEISLDAKGRQVGFAGDTFNTAAYLAHALDRAGKGAEVRVDYATVLGRDAVSDRMAGFIAAQGVGTEYIRRHPDRGPGAYAITLDGQGERSFTYWRSQSAARTLFEDGFGQLEGADMVYLSGITLAILPPDVRSALLGWLEAAPCKVAFDSNYRPRLWENPEIARQTTEAAWRITDVGLPSLDDEIALFGDADAQAVLARLRGYGLREGALKRGDAGPLPLNPDVPPGQFAAARQVVDTTAAGDSFNGAFLAATLCGEATSQAMQRGHDMALQVIARPGAIVFGRPEGD